MNLLKRDLLKGVRLPLGFSMVNAVGSLAGSLVALVLATPGAQAQDLIGEVLCGSQEDIHAKLARQFGAVKTGSGLRGPEAVLEIWTNPASGDWTLVQSYAEGRACILAMGEYWEDLTPDTAG